MSVLRIAIAITCHNRAGVTHRCLSSIDRIRLRPDVSCYEIRAFICDDGSSDGTAGVISEFPWCRRVSGNGSLFWTKGTISAIRLSLEWRPHWILILNDDVCLYGDSIARAASLSKLSDFATIVGQTVDGDGRISYGGYTREGGRFRFALQRTLVDGARPVPADTFNGNFVLIPTEKYIRASGLDASFTHRIADVDFGLRLKNAGSSILVLPIPIGVCSRNKPVAEALVKKAKSCMGAMRSIWGIKAWPPLQLLRYHVRHLGVIGIVTWARTQLRAGQVLLLACRRLIFKDHGDGARNRG